MLILCILTLTFAACDRTEPIGDSLDFATTFGGGTVEIQTATDTLTLGVEIAESDDQRRVGLMRRTSLAPDSGMIFLFQTEQAADGVFWMYQTLVPLSIAFIGADGTIGSIRDMEPCPSPYPQYCPNYEARVVLTRN
jgi:uncharacterized membrane protein (UPF0127 family)